SIPIGEPKFHFTQATKFAKILNRYKIKCINRTSDTVMAKSFLPAGSTLKKKHNNQPTNNLIEIDGFGNRKILSLQEINLNQSRENQLSSYEYKKLKTLLCKKDSNLVPKKLELLKLWKNIRHQISFNIF
ncbi:MAG: hypothetical protein NZM44_03965, partial [Candidatus Calescibacterium sp.]|nr:hypothetical protein [Candidatus Calescibacterium sp.]